MDSQDNLGYLFHHLSFVLARQSDQVLQEQLGLGFSQFKILLILQASPASQQRFIANKLGQTEASISRQIKLLHESGMVMSQVSPSNRREHIARLTPKGIKITDKAMELLNNYHAPIFSKLTERQQQHLHELLNIMHDATCYGPYGKSCHSNK